MLVKHKYYNSSSIFTWPSGVESIFVQAWGAGGGGSASIAGGGGGGGGAYSEGLISNGVAGYNYVIVIGPPGIESDNGGDAYFGSQTTILAKGGMGSNGASGGSGGSSSLCVGTVKKSGGNGGNGDLGGGGGGGSAGAGSDGSNGSNGGAFPFGIGGAGGTGGSQQSNNELSVSSAGARGGGGGGFISAGSEGDGPGGGGGGGAGSNGAVGKHGRIIISYFVPDDSPTIPDTQNPLAPTYIVYSGDISAAGNNTNGQFGLPTSTVASLTPLDVISSSGNVIGVAAGSSTHVAYLFENTKIITAGTNANGQCGQSGITNPAPLGYMLYDDDNDTSLSSIKIFQSGMSVAAGDNHTLVLDRLGTVWACGAGANGRLGIGTTSDRSWLVPSFSGINFGGSIRASRIAAGSNYSLIIDQFGRLYTCGANVNNQQGHSAGNQTNWRLNTETSGSYPLTGVAAGLLSSYVISSVSGLMAVGSNSTGQLGINSTASKSVFVQVSGLNGVQINKVVAGSDFAIALSSSGTVYSWGQGTSGKTGLGTTGNILSPMLVSGLIGINIVDIAAGTVNGYAVDNFGKVYSWGDNTNGQLGSGVAGTNRTVAGLVSGSIDFKFLHSSKTTNAVYAFKEEATLEANYFYGSGTILSIYGFDTKSASSNLLIHGSNSINNNVSLNTIGQLLSGYIPITLRVAEPKNNSLTMFIGTVVLQSTDFSWSIENLIKTTNYSPQLIGNLGYVGASGDVVIRIWQLRNGIPTELLMSNSGCYPVGNTGRWGFCVGNLPQTDSQNPQYYYRMSDPGSMKFDGEFFIGNKTPRTDQNSIFIRDVI